MCNVENGSDNVLLVNFAFLERLQDALSTRFECETAISVSSDSVVARDVGLSLDEGVGGGSDGVLEEGSIVYEI